MRATSAVGVVSALLAFGWAVAGGLSGSGTGQSLEDLSVEDLLDMVAAISIDDLLRLRRDASNGGEDVPVRTMQYRAPLPNCPIYEHEYQETIPQPLQAYRPRPSLPPSGRIDRHVVGFSDQEPDHGLEEKAPPAEATGAACESAYAQGSPIADSTNCDKRDDQSTGYRTNGRRKRRRLSERPMEAKVNCICKSPHGNCNLTQCGSCGEWFHDECVDVHVDGCRV